MSRIRVAALGAALLLGVSGVAVAQGAGTPGQVPGRGPGMAHRRGLEGRFAKDLNLTDAQKARIKTIHEKYRAQFEALRGQIRPQSGAPGTRLKRDSARVLRQKGDSSWRRGRGINISLELRQKLQTLRQQEQAEIRTVLTPEQRTKFDAMQAQRKQWMDQRGKHGRRARPAQSG